MPPSAKARSWCTQAGSGQTRSPAGSWRCRSRPIPETFMRAWREAWPNWVTAMAVAHDVAPGLHAVVPNAPLPARKSAPTTPTRGEVLPVAASCAPSSPSVAARLRTRNDFGMFPPLWGRVREGGLHDKAVLLVSVLLLAAANCAQAGDEVSVDVVN